VQKEPAAQGLDVAAVVPYVDVPAARQKAVLAHAVHAGKPAALHVPTGQSDDALAPAAQKEPAGQAVPVVAPTAAQKVPAAQGLAVAAALPAAVQKPAAHAVHADAPPALKVPATHAFVVPTVCAALHEKPAGHGTCVALAVVGDGQK